MLIALAGVWGLFQLSRPEVEGSLTLTGLEGPATIVRDERGIPTITAGTTHDAYFLLGFVHAQDRFLQMEMMRRLGAGRLAEVVGERAVGADRWSRTLGLYRAANTAFSGLDEETQASLEAYADGVNAWLAEGDQMLPPALLALGVEPEPWRPADSLVWQRLMALRLAGNWTDEIARARLLDAGLPPDRVAQLWPGAEDAPVTLPAPVRQAALPPAPPPELAPTLASNAWSLSPARSTTGGAVLANDPHLGFEAPILWYLATVRTPTWELAGATVPGVPFHLIGRNQSLGWGITTTHADTMDLFLETLADDGRAYETPGGPQPFLERQEVIRVRGGQDVTLAVRETRHGPVVSDLSPFQGAGEGPRQVTALAATALRPADRTPQALYHLNHAGSADQAREALRDFEAPMQNVFFADIGGATGFVSAGLVPVRRQGDGTVPVPGASGAWDWTGFVPYDDLPQADAPESGVLMNANNRVVPEDYPHLIAADWPAPWRALRAESLLARRQHLGLADSAAMQVDDHSAMAATLLPKMLAALPAGAGGEARTMLAGWDFRQRADRPEPLLFAAWLAEAEQAVFADELGSVFGRWGGERELLLVDVLGTGGWWCDDTATADQTETCGAVLAAALDRATTRLRDRFGSDMRGWRWGEAHRGAFVNGIYGRLPVVGELANLRPPMAGGNHTLLRAGYRNGLDLEFEAVHGAGLRMVLDLAEPERSRFVIATGQSENPLSPHYDDQLPLWLKGELLELDGEPVSVLRLNHDD